MGQIRRMKNTEICHPVQLTNIGGDSVRMRNGQFLKEGRI